MHSKFLPLVDATASSRSLFAQEASPTLSHSAIMQQSRCIYKLLEPLKFIISFCKSDALVAYSFKERDEAVASTKSSRLQNTRVPLILSVVLLLLALAPLSAFSAQSPSRKQLVQNWQNAGFGLFIHWGAYTQLHGQWKGLELEKDLWGEWIMKRAGISIPDYEAAIKPFNPSSFNAEEWADLAKEAGVRYLIITAKHHDGFAMYPSKASPYNLTDFCGFPRDPMKELSKACQENQIGFGFYYSHRIDWHDSTKSKDSFDAYWQKKCIPQVNELTSNYGSLAVMWFDMGCKDAEKVEQLLELVQKNQPNCVVNSRIGAGLGDYTSQKDCFVPAKPMDTPWETHMTLNEHWAWYPQDLFYKSPKEIIHTLLAVRSMGGNFLLNIGPDNQGRIPLTETLTLKRIGQWMQKYGDTVYGVQPSPLPRFPWGRCTQKGNTLYLHLFEWPSDGTLFVPGITSVVEQISFMADAQKTPLCFQQTPLGIEIKFDPSSISSEWIDPLATVLEMRYAQPLRVNPTPVIDHDFIQSLSASTAVLTGTLKAKRARYRDEQSFSPPLRHNFFVTSLTGFDESATATWSFLNARTDRFHLLIRYSLPPESKPACLQISCDGQTQECLLPPLEKENKIAPFQTIYLTELPLSKGTKKLTLSLKNPEEAKELKIAELLLNPSHLYFDSKK